MEPGSRVKIYRQRYERKERAWTKQKGERKTYEAILNTASHSPKRRGDPESSLTSKGCERREPYGAAACAQELVLGDPGVKDDATKASLDLFRKGVDPMATDVEWRVETGRCEGK